MRAAAVLAVAVLIPSAALAGDILSIGSKAPGADVYRSSGFNTAKAVAAARVTRQAVTENCEQYGFDVASCVAGSDLIGHETSASADCTMGKLVSDGKRYSSDGVWTSGIGEGQVRFRGSDGKVVGQDNASDGLGLAQRWETLCPSSPTGPRAESASVPASSSGPEIVSLDSLQGLPYDHNGSEMIVDAEKGLIVYARPKASIASAVKPGTVLFRGQPWSWDPTVSPVRGTAFVFKKGCAPAPYEVRGSYRGTEFALSGAAPVRSKTSCSITGTSNSSGNAELRFVSTYMDE